MTPEEALATAKANHETALRFLRDAEALGNKDLLEEARRLEWNTARMLDLMQGREE